MLDGGSGSSRCSTEEEKRNDVVVVKFSLSALWGSSTTEKTDTFIFENYDFPMPLRTLTRLTDAMSARPASIMGNSINIFILIFSRFRFSQVQIQRSLTNKLHTPI